MPNTRNDFHEPDRYRRVGHQAVLCGGRSVTAMAFAFLLAFSLGGIVTFDAGNQIYQNMKMLQVNKASDLFISDTNLPNASQKNRPYFLSIFALVSTLYVS